MMSHKQLKINKRPKDDDSDDEMDVNKDFETHYRVQRIKLTPDRVKVLIFGYVRIEAKDTHNISIPTEVIEYIILYQHDFSVQIYDILKKYGRLSHQCQSNQTQLLKLSHQIEAAKDTGKNLQQVIEENETRNQLIQDVFQSTKTEFLVHDDDAFF